MNSYNVWYLLGTLFVINLSGGESPILEWNYKLQSNNANLTDRVRLPMIDDAYEVGSLALNQYLPHVPRALYSIILEYAIEDDVVPFLFAKQFKYIKRIYPRPDSPYPNGFIMETNSNKISGMHTLYLCDIENNSMIQLYDSASYSYCKNIDQQKGKHVKFFKNNIENNPTPIFFDLTRSFYVNLNENGYLQLCSASDTHTSLLNHHERYEKLRYVGFYKFRNKNHIVIAASSQTSNQQEQTSLLRYSFCQDTLASTLLKTSKLLKPYTIGLSDLDGNFYHGYSENNADIYTESYRLHEKNTLFNPRDLSCIIDGFLHCSKIVHTSAVEPRIRLICEIIYTGGNKPLSWQFSTDSASIATHAPLQTKPVSSKNVKPSTHLNLARKQKQFIMNGLKFLTTGAFLYCYLNRKGSSAHVKSLGILAASSLALTCGYFAIFKPQKPGCSL